MGQGWLGGLRWGWGVGASATRPTLPEVRPCKAAFESSPISHRRRNMLLQIGKWGALEAWKYNYRYHKEFYS